MIAMIIRDNQDLFFNHGNHVKYHESRFRLFILPSFQGKHRDLPLHFLPSLPAPLPQVGEGRTLSLLPFLFFILYPLSYSFVPLCLCSFCLFTFAFCLLPFSITSHTDHFHKSTRAAYRRFYSVYTSRRIFCSRGR